jgi:hypothetical protein
MAITSLSEVTNDYGSYRGNSLIGERGTAVTVPNDGLEGIVGKPYPFLNGILLEIEGTLYTDQGYLNALKVAGNPYLSKRSLPVVSLKLSDLTELVPDIQVYDEDGPVYRTQYAEANITKRMSTIDDILFYLNDFFNPNTTDTVLEPTVIGSFNLGTTTYSPDLDVNGLYPGLEFETLEDIKTATTVKISTPPTQTEPKKQEPKVEVKVLEEKPLSVVIPPQQIETKFKTSTGITINTPTGTFTGINSNFLLGDADRNTGNADVRSTIRQLSDPTGLDRTGLRDAYDTGDFGPLGAMFDDGGFGSFGL